MIEDGVDLVRGKALMERAWYPTNSCNIHECVEGIPMNAAAST